MEMRGIVILLFCINITSWLRSQNLVPNPSFECGVDYCDPNQNSFSYPQHACGWASANGGTPDVLSTLIQDPTCFSSMPLTQEGVYPHIGSILPHTGNRFAGIITYSIPNRAIAPWEQWREYIEAKLNEPLISGETYCTEFYVAAASRAGYVDNNIGIY